MSKKKQNANNINKENIIKRLRIFLVAAIMVIIFYPPYLQGLFFEKHVLPTQIIVFSLFIIFLTYKWLKNDNTFFRTPIEYVSLGFVVVYFISIFVAVHTRSAIIEWLKYCMYFAVFYMVSDLADNLKTKLLFLWTIVISAVGVSIIGLDAALGGNIVGILNKFFRALGVQGNLFFGLFVDNRIHSTLQYPNALASYLLAVFFITVGLLMVHNKWWQKIILGSFSFILFLTFMLTRSRGAQLIFPIVVIILFIAAPKGKRVNAVTYVVLLAIPAVVISLLMSPYLSAENLNQKALLFLISGLLVTVLISTVVKFVGNLLQKINWKVYITIISVFIITIIIGLNFVINSSLPVELSLLNSEENKTISISKDVALKPNKEYILRFEAESKMREERPYAFSVRINNKNINNILFYGSEQLVSQDFSSTNAFEEFEIMFSTKEDTKLVNVNFSIYYTGTSVKINDASIIDADTGKTVREIILKNKYNLDSVISGFQNIWLQQSLVSRAIFYRDGLNIFKDKWFFGAGGGAWNYLYRQYQSYNYASSQAHNYPLQLGIETGILGIIILLGLVIVLVVTYSLYSKKTNNYSDTVQVENSNLLIKLLSSIVITAIASLFMHSIIDFDFSESSMLLLFWQLIGLFNRELIDNKVIEDIELFTIGRKSKRSKYEISKKRKSSIFVGIVISVITLYFSSSFFIASSLAKQSFENLQNNNIEAAINKMEKAIILDRYNEKYILGHNPIPNRPDIKTGLTDILFMKNEKIKKAQENGENISEYDLSLLQKQFSKAALYIKEIEKKAQNNLSLTSDLASFCFKTGEIDKGIDYLNAAISYFPFEPSLWHSKVNVYYQLMKEYFNNEDYEKAKEYLLKGLNVIDEAKKINKKNINPFVFNQNTVELLQIMKFMQDNWDSDEIYNVNEVIHYSIFSLDINLDDLPDQWQVYYGRYQSVITTKEGNFEIDTQVSTSLFTRYPINLEKGETYIIEIQLSNPIENLYYYIPNVVNLSSLERVVGNYYRAEFKVEGDTNSNGNQLELFFNSSCIIESIIVKKKI